ncbi:MAG: YbaB/EbfC family nucleoid-associated protein [Eubacteriales bacterium]|nr:YbaB/EbfC family nucleoid-associated protein [Eubacteriales bacterium]MDD4461620.1 YbaB/EbfC family nucleoid-associated protein [Eubacteriales bacterium]
MAKGPRGFRGAPAGGGMNQYMQQAQKLQRDMEKAQEDIAAMTCEGTAGGQVVRAVMDGQHRLVELAIDPAAVDADDVEMLQDLIMVAVNAARDKMEEASNERMSQVTGGRGLPFGL